MPNFRLLPESPANPYRLGRHQMLDLLVPEREAVVPMGTPVRSVEHEELVQPFDQGDLGSCTANAALGCLVTAPFGQPGVAYTETDAVALYRLETQLDDSQIPGQYPPDDTGSTGPWSMLALEKQGLVRSFRHTRSLMTALRLLNAGPISIGVAWYQSMFTPDPNGLLTVDEGSGVAGGHQVCITADDADRRRVRVRNSWGTSWGDAGHAWLSWDDLDDLLRDGGDVVQPILGGTHA